MEYTPPQDDQDSINEAEWQARSSWIGPRSCGIYWSKRDTRLAVPYFPKPSSKLYAFNYAHPKVWAVLIAGLSIGATVLILAGMLVANLLQPYRLAATVVGGIVGAAVATITFLVINETLKPDSRS